MKVQSREEVIQKVQELTAGQVDPATIQKTADRIMNKMESIQGEYFRWWELLIAIFMSITGYYIPLWILKFQRRMRAMEMQNEVDQFHVLISILMQFDRISVETILEWMEQFSVVFKPALRKCLLNFDSGAEQALQTLREEAPFQSFDRIVKRLIRAYEKVSVAEAFDDLEMEQEYYAKEKDERLMRLIKKKASWAQILGFVPGALLIGLYLVFPMLYMSFQQLTVVTQQITNF
ncbi:hypothetical protein [Brevibacillus reuszeri]|uniref:hypothetical protein n=1 Tax=Brevibacillus reuszeri TaxID=54915 RepID=UPI000CCC35D5|nr:hypothetical protein [Brevibacillus reuszeri]